MANIIRTACFILISIAIGFMIGTHYQDTEPPDIKHPSLTSYDVAPDDIPVTRTEILNTLIEKYKYESYLEIGQGDRQDNHDWIECPIRIGVDPDPTLKAAYQMTSDAFFDINNDSYDLIFIDGLHQEEQAYRDIINSLEVLNENGTIVVHDCNPTEKAMQVVPQIQGLWTGDVWKAWIKLRASRDDLQMYVIDNDFGCGVIRRGTQETINIPDEPNYEEFDLNRERWLNLVSIDWFISEMKTGM